MTSVKALLTAQGLYHVVFSLLFELQIDAEVGLKHLLRGAASVSALTSAHIWQSWAHLHSMYVEAALGNCLTLVIRSS